MRILKHLLFWPVTGPVAMARFSLGQVDAAVRRELTDDVPVKEALLELQLRLEMGEVDEDEYVAREAELMQRLRETRHWREQFGMQEAWRPLGSGTSGEGREPSEGPSASSRTTAEPAHARAEVGARPVHPGSEPASARGESGPARDPAGSGPPALLASLPRRFTFVVGKGGVGKTTTAGALALALGDAGLMTHLISTDPAHSIGDLFGRTLPPGVPAALTDASRVTVEEFDAGDRDRTWLGRLAAGAGELIERGTYLDADDATALIEPALPGLGEMMAAIRLTELENEGAERIVVDTAPTGHALRLLECGTILEGWIEALDAMNDKARAVHERLVRQALDLDSGTLLEELRDHARRFEQRVLPAADFLVVSGPDPIVRRESERLIERLESMGLRVAVRFDNRHTPDGERGGRGPEGVTELRHWWKERVEGNDQGPSGPGRRSVPADPAPTSTTHGPPEKPDPDEDRLAPTAGDPGSTDPDIASLLGGRRLLFFAGKGGVGKSTCAAACAVAFARDRPVLLLGVDPAGSLRDLLGSHAMQELRLEVREVDSAMEFLRFREQYLNEIRRAFDRLVLDGSVPLDRRVMESLLNLAPPGIDEIFGLRALLEGVLTEEATDRRRMVIVDTAPTGHFLRLLEMPESAITWSRAVMRLLVKYRTILGLEDLAPGLLDFARDLRTFVDLLGDPSRTGVVVVAQDEMMVRAETNRLITDLELRAIPVALVLLNRHRSECGAPRVERSMETGSAPAVPAAVAPESPDSPSGAEALTDFFSRWRMVR